ncbi:acyl-ACP thioesterase domain-containing protein [Reichenbachiella sp. MALMAid0571]|uniref:acyl-[acyl-carrier-protein] thioesterase n=1 Tax=Reichenbachiella sp. MALMAid0571 TaxID=3143939 RepID=UPI0032DEC140
MEESVFFDSFKVKASETDASKSIKVPSLLGYMQEAAWTNATKLGFSTYDMLKEGITWVVNRMYVEFLELPSYPQVLKIETWPSDLDKYFAYRDFRVFDESSNLLVQATSNWLVLDINTRKLITIPDHIKNARFSVNRGGMDKIQGKCTFDQIKIENEIPIRVSWFDLDVNNHVNNTKYFQWILDSLDQHVLEKKKPKSVDITFKAEAGYGDEIVSQSYEIDENSYAHQIINQSTGKVLVVARSVFE